MTVAGGARQPVERIERDTHRNFWLDKAAPTPHVLPIARLALDSSGRRTNPQHTSKALGDLLSLR